MGVPISWIAGAVDSRNSLHKHYYDAITNQLPSYKENVLICCMGSFVLCANGFEPIYCTSHFNLYAKDDVLD